jgi:hypothetical protein
MIQYIRSYLPYPEVVSDCNLRTHHAVVMRRNLGPRGMKNRGLEKTAHKDNHNLYSSPNIIKMIESVRMRCAGNVARMREKRNAHRSSVGKSEGNKPLGRIDVRKKNSVVLSPLANYTR